MKNFGESIAPNPPGRTALPLDIFETGLSPYAVVLYAGLCVLAGGCEQIQVTREDLAAMTRLSTGMVSKVTRELPRAKRLRTERLRRREATTYFLPPVDKKENPQ